MSEPRRRYRFTVGMQRKVVVDRMQTAVVELTLDEEDDIRAEEIAKEIADHDFVEREITKLDPSLKFMVVEDWVHDPGDDREEEYEDVEVEAVDWKEVEADE